MELYPWVVLVHVIAAFLFILAHGASAIVSFRLRAERDPTRILALLDLSASTIGPMYGTLGLLLLAGIAAGIMGNWFSKGWIWLALGIFVAITVLMYVVATTYYVGVRRALGQVRAGSKEPAPQPLPTEQLLALLDSRRPEAIAAIGVVGLVVILWLMEFKPF
jgi:Predicted integral membrane protein (DUF2269)